MALRLSETHQSPASMGVGASAYMGNRGVGAFQDDRTPFIEETPLSNTYVGLAGLSEIEFLATPGLKGLIANAAKGASKFKEDILRVEVWQDTSPGGFTGNVLQLDKYRIRIWTRGDVQAAQGQASTGEIINAAKNVPGGIGVVPILAGIGFILLAKIILVVGAAAILGVVLWKISRTSWGKALTEAAQGVTSPLILAVLLGGAVLLLSNRPNKRGRVNA